MGSEGAYKPHTEPSKATGRVGVLKSPEGTHKGYNMPYCLGVRDCKF